VTTWQRAPVLDEWDEDGRRAIFVNDQVIVVSELAAAILDRLPADADEIGEHLVAEFGAPPGDLPVLVADFLQELSNSMLILKPS
jgi:hypothetical protein